MSKPIFTYCPNIFFGTLLYAVNARQEQDYLTFGKFWHRGEAEIVPDFRPAAVDIPPFAQHYSMIAELNDSMGESAIMPNAPI